MRKRIDQLLQNIIASYRKESGIFPPKEKITVMIFFLTVIGIVVGALTGITTELDR